MSEHALEDTQELDLSELQDDPTEAEVARRLPQPAVVRAAVISVLGLVGSVIGRSLSADAWLDAALDVYTVAAPAAVYLWFHRNAKGVERTVAKAEEYVGKHRAA